MPYITMRYCMFTMFAILKWVLHILGIHSLSLSLPLFPNQSICLISYFSFYFLLLSLFRTHLFIECTTTKYIAVIWTAQPECMSECCNVWMIITLYVGNDPWFLLLLLLLLLSLLSLHFDIYMNFSAMCVFSCHEWLFNTHAHAPF